jgi:phage protein D
MAPAEVGPFGAASEQGAEAWSLVHHQPGGSGVHRVLPAVRDREAASAVDQAVAAAHERTAAAGRVVSTGQPKVRAGDLVELDGVERAGATYRVRRARHRIDGAGFRTALDVEAA